VSHKIGNDPSVGVNRVNFSNVTIRDFIGFGQKMSGT